MTRILCQADDAGRHIGRLDRGLPGGWYLILLRVSGQSAHWLVSLRSEAGGADRRPNEYLLATPAHGRLFSGKFGVCYLPPGQSRFVLDLHGRVLPPDRLTLRLLRLPRPLASLLLPLQNLPVFRRALAAASGGPRRRLRQALFEVGASGPYFPASYADWLDWFDRSDRLDRAAAAGGLPTIAALVLRAGPPGPALARTLASLRRQSSPPCAVTVLGAQDDAPTAPPGAAYTAVLQAGEALSPQALRVLAEAVRGDAPPLILLADEDRIGADGQRSDPLFKPAPHLTLMCSGLLATGVWLIRSDLLAEPERPVDGWAACLRLRAWFRLFFAGEAGRAHRLPALLTHRGDDAEQAPPAAVAAVVAAFLAAAGFAAEVAPATPLRVSWLPGRLARTKVSLLVPSRLCGETQLACMQAVLRRTAHADFEMLVIVAQPEPLDAGQKRAAARLTASPKARVEWLPQPSFNYAAANNAAAALSSGDFICLLNDDVTPIDPSWLDRLLGFFQDPACGIAGPRLLYPDRSTQHGGVILGLGGLVDHAFRFLPQGQSGYAGRAGLDQEYSAVTGACLLTRRTVFEQAGGLDEAYPAAFNDIDFCLRVRQRGHGVVYAGSVEMIHHESLTFIRHFEGDDETSPDVRRFRTQWSGGFATDPFHNPNLSLKPRSEWQLAFPPRTGPG